MCMPKQRNMQLPAALATPAGCKCTALLRCHVFVKSSNRRAGGRALSLIRLDASGWPACYPSYGNAAYGWQEQALFASVPSAPSCEAMQLVTCIYWVVGPGMC